MIRENSPRPMVADDGRDVLLGNGVPKEVIGKHAEAQESAVGVRRALLARLLVDRAARTRVVVDHRELGRLFGRRQDDVAWEVFSPRLRVFDSLESVIEHLEAEMAKADTRLMQEGGRDSRICWFTTPGVDFDVVFQTLQRARNHHLVGLLFGPWPYGSAVYTLENTTRLRNSWLSRKLWRGTPAMTEEEAFGALTSCRIDLTAPSHGDESIQGGV